MRRTPRARPLGLILLAALLPAACAVNSLDGSREGVASASATRIDTGRAVVDVENGQIELPLDRYFHSDQEMWAMEYASDLLMADCMEEEGLQFKALDYREQEVRTTRRYGIWRKVEALALGYRKPPDDAIRTEAMALNAGDPSPEWQARYQTCIKDQRLADLRVDAPPNGLEGLDSYELAMVSDDGAAAWRAWADCLEGQGLTPPSEGEWISRGWATANLERQISTAIADVDCKDSLNTVQVMADIEAEYQAGMLAGKEALYEEQSRLLDDALKRANEVIRAHGG